ncbi:hypothetical protein B0H66DRAFT_621122 [Apodospora peruviana]|uniref:O-methyltransferase C-terminal domain-containing protein n=1 Tax=Apodospora peruviana TaxID=516989 RepID=A0AAE0M8P1_9PEZI|nr:hypothetical protein B0H66DRAFT_621122 [Apodospora peruviana]
MPVDIHARQPVENARADLLRRVLHDYGDEECATILRILKAAIGPDSKVVIMEVVLDDLGTSGSPFWYAMDMAMMGIGGKERTGAEGSGMGGFACWAGLELDLHVETRTF